MSTDWIVAGATLGLRPGAYLLGVGIVVLLAASVLLFAATLRRLLLPKWDGALAGLASTILALSVLITLCEVLGSVGLFRRWALVVGALLIAAGAALFFVPARKRRQGVSRRCTPNVSPIEAGLVVAAVVLALTPWVEELRSAYAHGMREFDTNWYHLPIAARFVQTGWLTRLQYLNNPPDTFLPANSEVFHAVGMVAVGRDLLSPLINLGWIAVAFVAAWCLGRPWGARAPALVAVALVVSIPVMVTSQAGSAGNDVVGLALLLAAAGLIVNAPTSRPAVAISGLAAGLAIGTKLTLVAPILALSGALAVVWIRARSSRLAAVWAGALLFTGSFWYLRNAARADNPFPWFRLGLGRLALPTTTPPVDCGNTSIAHYLTNTDVIRYAFRPALGFAFGVRWPFLIGLAAAGIVLAIRGRPLERILGAVALLSALAYIWTPATAGGTEGHPTCFYFNTRFSTPALTLGLLLVALASTRWRRLTPTMVAAAFVVLLAANVPFTPLRLVFAIAAALVAGVLTRFSGRVSALRLAAAGSIVGVAAVGLGWPVQAHYFQHRYADGGLPEPIGPSYVRLRRISHARIAVGGFSADYPLYGADLSNWVDYPAHKGPHGIFRRITSCGQWHEALSLGRFEYVVTDNPYGAAPPRETAWTRSYPGATRIMRIGTNEVFSVRTESLRNARHGCREQLGRIPAQHG